MWVLVQYPAPVFTTWVPGLAWPLIVGSAAEDPRIIIPLAPLPSGYRQDETTRHYPVRSNHLRVPSIISAILSFSWELSTAATGPACSCRPLPSLA